MAISSDIISYTQARNNLKAVMDKVWDDSTPVVITRAGGKSVVVMSKDDYDSMKETEYLLSSPVNAGALRESIAQVEAGKTVPMKLNKAGTLVRAE
jgi:antitoxin YefM